MSWLSLESILDKRVVLKWLPIYFGSDLLHGSWWYVVSSILGVACALIVLLDSYKYVDLGNDDSVLPHNLFQLAWGLCLLSSVFFTIGSLIFIRACNDPPLPPIWKVNVFPTDELFGMWLMVIAVFPAVPYCFIYLSVSHSGVYFVGFIVAICLLGGLFIIIYTLYPKRRKEGEKERPYRDNAYILYLMTTKYWSVFGGLCCCLVCGPSRSDKTLHWLETHCATDWTVATWLNLWATGIGTFLFLLFFLYEVAHHLNRLSIFVYLMR